MTGAAAVFRRLLSPDISSESACSDIFMSHFANFKKKGLITFWWLCVSIFQNIEIWNFVKDRKMSWELKRACGA